MILSALNNYYETLLAEGKVLKLGWSSEEIAFILELSEEGRLQGIIPMEKGYQKTVPMPVQRTSNIVSNFLFDKSDYLLGIHKNKTSSRLLKCFEAARQLHHEILDSVSSPVARAVLAFFDRWDPAHFDRVIDNDQKKKLLKGGKLILSVQTEEDSFFPIEDPEIKEAWNAYYKRKQLGKDGDKGDDKMVCLVTGEYRPIAITHPLIKDLTNAEPVGAKLVSFNERSFESYGNEKGQGRNAPVSTRVAEAYAKALNYLIKDPDHHAIIGDTTLVFWSEHQDTKNSETFSNLMFRMPPQSNSMDAKATDLTIKSILEQGIKGKPIQSDIDLNARFFILGLTPNITRIAVHFFLQDTFGNMLKNITRHYKQMEIEPNLKYVDYLPAQLIRSVEVEVEDEKRKKNKKGKDNQPKNESTSSPLLSPLLKAILTGSKYPEALYQKVLLRVHASRNVKHAHAAIIKAYLLRNRHRSGKEITVELNEELTEHAYLLGRLFALFEQIQKSANTRNNKEDQENKENTVSTITSSYFNAANTSPASVFPMLYRLSLAHLRKLERDNGWLAHRFTQQRNEILMKVQIGDNEKKTDEVSVSPKY